MTADSPVGQRPVPPSMREGRLVDPAMDLTSDVRTNPSLLAKLQSFGLAAHATEPPLSRENSLDERLQYIQQAEERFEAFYGALHEDPTVGAARVSRDVRSIGTPEGTKLDLHIYRPEGVAETMPCLMHLHSGGMAILTVDNDVHRHWCEDLARSGLVVVAVDFRNSGGVNGPFPFPAGLDDCAAALAWITSHKHDLGVTGVVALGESGGANLALSTAIKAKRDGVLDSLDGVYAVSPYISGGYGWPAEHKLRELPSMVENDGYFATSSALDIMASIYDPDESNTENPLAWPYFAACEDLEGLPPHIIAVNELDPLRDEGLAYCRKLLRAGVSAYGRVNLGLTHMAEIIFRESVREANAATIADINRFAHSVTQP